MPWLDAHLDLAYMALDGRDLCKPCEDRDQACISLPALREADVDLVFATIFSAPGPLPEADAQGWEHPCRYPSSDDLDAAEKAGLCQIELYQQLEEAGELSIVRGRVDLEADTPLPKIVLLMEGADPIRSPQHAQQWYDDGLRLVGLTWSMGTRYAAGNAKPGPLTAQGIELVAALDDLGIIHDASHLADEALDGLLEHARGPIVATHSNCRAITGDNQRHLRDAHIKAIGDRGGVIGLNLFSKFLVPDGRATIDDCVAHGQHVCDLIGHRNGVGLGSDADGGFAANALPVDLDHPRKYGALLESLRTAGWSNDDLQSFSWGNWEGMLRQLLYL